MQLPGSPVVYILGTYTDMDEDMKEKGREVVPLDVLEERMKTGVVSVFGEVCTIRVVCGVTEEDFMIHQLSLSEVEEKC